MKITPVLIVDEIETLLPFWVDRMGFEKTVEVPDGSRLGFVILVQNRTEVMLQSAESVRKDVGNFGDHAGPGSVHLFIEVDDFAGTRRRLDGYPIALAERVTFYGMREIGVKTPSGHAVIFATPEK